MTFCMMLLNIWTCLNMWGYEYVNILSMNIFILTHLYMSGCLTGNLNILIHKIILLVRIHPIVRASIFLVALVKYLVYENQNVLLNTTSFIEPVLVSISYKGISSTCLRKILNLIKTLKPRPISLTYSRLWYRSEVRKKRTVPSGLWRRQD